MSKIIEPSDKPGYTPPIRCHRCGTSKADEDVGVWLVFETEFRETKSTHKVWFHNQEDRDIWVLKNSGGIRVIDESKQVQEQSEKSNESKRQYQE